MPLNALGVICAAGYTGFATTPSHSPWIGFMATVIFFVAAVRPLFREHRRLKFGFKDIETTYLENRKREHSPSIQEVFAPEPPTFINQKHTRSNYLSYALSIIAVILLVSDVAYRQSHLPAESTSADKISNF